MSQVKVGVVGTGMMGQRHCRVYSTLRRTELVGICDARHEIGAEIARQYDVPFYSQIDDLLDQVDAISLVTPTPLHFDMAMRCLDKGVHVLVEKPITEAVEQAEQLTTAAEASGLVVQVGHIERFNPAYMELKSVLEEVHVLAINLRRLSAYEASNTDVDVILDLMIHDLDLVLDLVGREPTMVSAYGLTSYSSDAIDHAVAHLHFESGPLLTLTASRVTEQKIRSIEVTAQETYLECDLLNKNISAHRRTIGEYLNHNQRGVKYRHESIVERIHVPIFEPLFSELQHFVDCILADKQPSVPARDGLRALRLAKTVQNNIREQLIKTNGRDNASSGQYDVAELVARPNGHRKVT
jgi:predicted dehydrogenase